MTLIDLKALIAKGQMLTLEIHAFEGIIYLVKIVTEVGETMLKKQTVTIRYSSHRHRRVLR